MLYSWCKQKRYRAIFTIIQLATGAEKSFNNPDFDEVKYRNIDVEERCILIRAMFITCCDSPGFRDESKVSWEYTANIIFFHFGEAIFFYDFAYCIHDSGPLPEIICFPIFLQRNYDVYSLIKLQNKLDLVCWISYVIYIITDNLWIFLWDKWNQHNSFEIWSTVAILSRSYPVLWTHGQCVFWFISKNKEVPFLLF